MTFDEKSDNVILKFKYLIWYYVSTPFLTIIKS
jgi:hypothetical protein